MKVCGDLLHKSKNNCSENIVWYKIKQAGKIKHLYNVEESVREREEEKEKGK